MRHMLDIIRDQCPLVLPPDTTVQHAAEKMRDGRVGSVLVARDDDHLVGIFTGRDAVCRVLAAGRNPVDTLLGDVMTPDPTAMPPGGTAIEALRMMQDGGYRHLPVVDHGHIVGVVSRGDFRGLEKAQLDEETGLWERI